MDYETIERKVIYQGKVFKVSLDTVRKPTGETTRVDLVEHAGAVVLVPLDASDRVWLVRQYRHPTGMFLLELPAGTLDPGEDPIHCAIRECREEIGLSPSKIDPLGGFYLAPGYSTEFIHAFLVGDFQKAPLPMDSDEDLHPVQFSWPELENLIRTGEIIDAKTISALYLAREHLS